MLTHLEMVVFMLSVKATMQAEMCQGEFMERLEEIALETLMQKLRAK